MKTLALALMLSSSVAFAVEVTVTGVGNSYDSALQNAKQEAIEQVASTFIISEKNYKQKQYSESIDQYNAGIIKSHKVIQRNRDDYGLHHVTILADVEPKKDNRIHNKQSAEFTPMFVEFEERRKVVDRLDNVNQAVSVSVSKPSYVIGREETIVSIDVSLKLQPKWVSDIKSFAHVIDEKGSTTTNTYSSIHGSIVSSLIGSNPVAAVLVGAFGEPEYIQMKEEMMVCFSGRRGSFIECNNIGVDFAKLPRTPKVVVVGIADGANHLLYKAELDFSGYEFVYPGERRYHNFFKSYKKTFNQPALILYVDETQNINPRFKVDNKIAKNMKEVKVFLQ
jgi:hypothetical protein